MPKGWKLMWAPTTMETAEAAQDYQFHRIDREIVLVYGKKESPLLLPATDKNLQFLTDEEKLWLKDAIDTVTAEIGERRKAKAMQNDLAFMDAFERELRAERDKMNGGEGNGGYEENGYNLRGTLVP